MHAYIHAHLYYKHPESSVIENSECYRENPRYRCGITGMHLDADSSTLSCDRDTQKKLES